jgi:(1->4)-alpha-D-glucan 1-alpha-D-glucosylmutase
VSPDGPLEPRFPVSTYRLQFNDRFTFAAARDLVGYLFDLGVTDVYASPCFKARPGSLHGYEIVDFGALNPELGTEEDFDNFTGELRRRGMGLVLDIVPNHMCITCADNAWWSDVLENGQSSPYAGFFDIDWNPLRKALENKVLIPILGDQYGNVLENQELPLVFEDGAFAVTHHENRLPIAPDTYAIILTHRLEDLESRLAPESPDLTELRSIITALGHLPPYTEIDPERIAERQREKEVIKKRLAGLTATSGDCRSFLGDNVRVFNGNKGDARSFDLLDGFLGLQVWRLSNWRLASEEINYRRFFDINDLAAVRMEYAPAFDKVHALAFRLVGEGKITGLRIDHLDGLFDPAAYLAKLEENCRPSSPYVVGEKILSPGESLPEDWQIHGTTGYEFLVAVNGLFVDARNGKTFDEIYGRFIRRRLNFQDVVYEKKKLVIQTAMSGEINRLARYLSGLAEKSRHTRDFTLNSLVRAITEFMACFPVYRTYIHGPRVADTDRRHIELAAARARRRNPAISRLIFDFLRDVLLLDFPESLGDEDRSEWLDFDMKFQQVSGPVMAKGLEDTSFYVFNRLVSLNEVGGTPDRFGTSVEAFHALNLERTRRWPHGLTATSTHDTKRSEDVRARISVLSEVPHRWRECLGRWSRRNRRKKKIADGQAIPDRNEEYLFYQTLIGAWPIRFADADDRARFRNRIKDYMLKAAREAKDNTSWVSPDASYEGALLEFIDAVLDDGRFLEDFRDFQAVVSRYGMFNSLSQTLLKIAAPGVPDFYQGTEVWDFSLVDPDNRRPVDYGSRVRRLAALREKAAKTERRQLARELTYDMGDGVIKLFLISEALNYRRDHRAVFERGEYLALAGFGPASDHLCAFARRSSERVVVAAVPRLLAGLVRPDELPLGRDVWGDTVLELPYEDEGRTYRNIFTGERVVTRRSAVRSGLALAEVLSDFPVALLERLPD